MSEELSNLTDNKFIDPYACKEAERFYKRGYVGISHGSDNGYSWGFDTTNNDLVATSILEFNHRYYCAYCMNKAKSIQGLFHKSKGTNYKVTGHTCVCSGAMSERSFNESCNDLREEFNARMTELRKTRHVDIDESKLAAFSLNVLNKEAKTSKIFRLDSISSPKLNDERYMPEF